MARLLGFGWPSAGLADVIRGAGMDMIQYQFEKPKSHIGMIRRSKGNADMSSAR